MNKSECISEKTENMSNKDMNEKEKNLMDRFDVIVVGAGHAGCEAALASARMGLKTCLFSMNLEAIAMMPCNPSIGGTGKGHLVREIDALGGEMGINIDKSFIQSRMLNTSKGPAVHSLRAQADKALYHTEMKKHLRNRRIFSSSRLRLLNFLWRMEMSRVSLRRLIAYTKARQLFCVLAHFCVAKYLLGTPRILAVLMGFLHQCYLLTI